MTKKTLKKGDTVQIIGKRWFERTNGNTYHSVDVYVNNEQVEYVPFKYGYERQYEQTALEILRKHYELPKEMDKYASLWHLKELGISVLNDVTDVPRKKDLATGGKMAEGGGVGRFVVENGGRHNLKSVWNVRDSETKILKTSFRDKTGAKLYAEELNKNPNLWELSI